MGIQRILGLLLVAFSVTLLPPMAVSLWYADDALRPFVLAFGLTLTAGTLIWLPVHRLRRDLRLRDGFVIVAMFWIVLGLLGALPFMFAPDLRLSFTDAVFESVSGWTTTGATVLTHIDDLPRSLLYYRQQLQWLGGMGIVVLAVAVLPMLGIGGMQLYRAGTPGRIKDSKLTPRIAETARALWYIYLGLTVACALAYWLAGMSAFDALAHSFSTVATGGFSTHDAGMAYFANQPLVQLVAIPFMLLAGASFALHFVAWRSFSLRRYWQDSEFKTYLAVIALVVIVTCGYLYYSGMFARRDTTVLEAVFQSVAIVTTTGFTAAPFHSWPNFIPVLLLFSSFIGACAGSTGGGMKAMRFLLLLKQGRREVARVIHPNAVVHIRLDSQALPDRVVDSVWGFFAAYVASFSVVLVLLMATGLHEVSAFSAVAACMNNLGPGLGALSANYASVTPAAKWILAFAMVLGRLEVFTLLVLLTPAFWRR